MASCDSMHLQKASSAHRPSASALPLQIAHSCYLPYHLQPHGAGVQGRLFHYLATRGNFKTQFVLLVQLIMMLCTILCEAPCNH